MMDKIMLYGRLMKIVTVAISAVTATAYVYMMALAAFDASAFEQLLSGYLSADAKRLTFGPAAILAVFLVATFNLGIISTGLYSVWRIGDGFAHGAVFSTPCGLWLRRLGAVLLAGAASSVVSRALSIALATIEPNGGHMLIITLGTHEAFLTLVGLMMMVLGQVIVLAMAIDAENKAFI